MSVEYNDILKLQKQIQALREADKTAFLTATAKEAAARLWDKVRNDTPLGVYPSESGKTGGTLRRGWAVRGLEVQKMGDSTIVSIRIINPVHYASYVEYGHRQKPGRFVPAIGKRLVKGWVEGKFILRKAEMELEDQLPGIIERKLQKLFNETFK